MYVKKMCGYVVSTDISCTLTKGLLDSYSPPTQYSRNYKNWIAVLDLKNCLKCRSHHGQIYRIDEMPDIELPLHLNCRCDIKLMKAVVAGYGTKDGQNGADYWMKYFNDLPMYYITKDELVTLGWKWGKPPAKFAPGKWLQWEFIETTIIICPKFRDESGMKPTSIITAEDEMDIAFYGQMTVCCLSPIIIMGHF